VTAGGDGTGGDGAAALRARHAKVLPAWLTLYYAEPIELVRGEGVHVWDSAGNRYLDFFGGILTTISGHNVPELTRVITEQTGKLNHTSTLYLIRSMVELAERLTELAPVDPPTKAFFAAIGITGQKSWSASSYSPFQVSYALTPYCYRCPFGLKYPDCGVACAEDLRNVIETTTTGAPAAMIAEPIQGVGGFVTPPPEYFGIVKSILDDFGIPLIADEVQTGFGRTGEAFWGIESYGVRPDAVVMAKGLGNGLAIGGVVAKAEWVDSLRANHISTFGGGPVASAYAVANLDYIRRENLQANAARMGRILWDGLKPLERESPIVGEVRGKGLMVGVEMVTDHDSKEPNVKAAAEVMERCRERGLLVGKGGLYANTLRLAPPLTVTEQDVGQAVETIRAAVDAAQGA